MSYISTEELIRKFGGETRLHWLPGWEQVEAAAHEGLKPYEIMEVELPAALPASEVQKIAHRIEYYIKKNHLPWSAKVVKSHIVQITGPTEV